MLDTGRHPHMGFKPHQNPLHMESVNEFKEQMEESLAEVKSALGKSKEDMECYYNWCCMSAPIFAPGDKVYLDASYIQTTHPLKKLAHRWLGPYIVEHQVGLHAYCLWLPKSMSQLHLIFPVVTSLQHWRTLFLVITFFCCNIFVSSFGVKILNITLCMLRHGVYACVRRWAICIRPHGLWLSMGIDVHLRWASKVYMTVSVSIPRRCMCIDSVRF